MVASRHSVMSTNMVWNTRECFCVISWLAGKKDQKKETKICPKWQATFVLNIVRRHEAREGTARNLLQVSVLFLFQETNGIERASSKRPNPHKYLLYKPTLSQLHVFMACGVKVGIHFPLMRAKYVSLSRYLFARLAQSNERFSFPENAKTRSGLYILTREWLNLRILKASFHTLWSHITQAKIIQCVN